ncbi:hypothetical protein FZD47_02400 [Bacillus infantis]|uniref:Uncharacterized protein n=1 Tax=Bacillus infantis TaxID=324767 RepID=A0A5D4SSK2_9BACI|nr:hypothetical protein [Bacillus infantis]TYS66357.1 hypothetical protein FZD47_02400 [Bacillus infantis]
MLLEKFELLNQAIAEMYDWFISRRDIILQIIKDYKPIHELPTHPAVKRHVLQEFIVKHQVINRKPMRIRARASC